MEIGEHMAQNARKHSNLVDVIAQIHAAADADYRRKMATGIETTVVEAKLSCTEELLAAIQELQDISDDFLESLREDPHVLLRLFPEVATAVH